MSRALYFLGGSFYRLTFSISQRKQVRRLSTDNGQKTTVISGRWRRFWRSWVPIPTTVGVTVLAVLQWRRLQRGRSQEPTVARDWEINVYKALPNRVLSRAWGWMSNCYVPRPLRPKVYGFYSSLCGVNLDEVEKDITEYPSLACFFTRALKMGARPIDSSKCIVSPADGKVVNCGQIFTDCVQQIKGATYKIQVFLGPPTWRPSSQKVNLREPRKKETDENDNEINASKAVRPWSNIFLRKKEQVTHESWEDYKQKLLTNPNNELYQFIIYLAPGDYHRFHSPVHWHVKFRRHFQGELLSVNPLIASWVPELFSLNERVVYTGEWEHGFFSYTTVGATNVGSIKVHCDKTLETNTRKWKGGVRHKDKVMNAIWKKGEEVGEFRMGSTIVLIFEAPKDFVFDVKQNEKVVVGKSILKSKS